MKQLTAIIYFFVLFSTLIFCQTTDLYKPRKIITDDDIGPNQLVKFSKDTVYVLNGYVFVEENSILEIEAGTVIKSLNHRYSENGYPSSLIICRDAKIIAEGTKEEPIIFTSNADSVAQPRFIPPDEYEYSEISWGSIYILGKARTNSEAYRRYGFSPELGEDGRQLFSGEDDADSSGVLRYISVRYSGDGLRNGICMGCVGSRTKIEYVEVVCNLPGSFWLVSSTINLKYIASIFGISVGFNLENYRGKGQHFFSIKYSHESSGRFFFTNGYSINPVPLNDFSIFNATLLGVADYINPSSGVCYFQHNTHGQFSNSIISQLDSPPFYLYETWKELLTNDSLKITNNLVYQDEETLSWELLKTPEYMIGHLDSNHNIITNPLLYGISRTNNGGLDPRPRPESPAWTMDLADYPEDDFFEPVNYAGAFGTENWLEGWSWLWQMGYFDTTSTGIESPFESVPADYKLEQNYPNPFNPSTRIKYQITKPGQVELVVYDLLGREIEKLVDKYQSAGNYEVEFDGSGICSSIYFYRLKAGSYVETRKMILTK